MYVSLKLTKKVFHNRAIVWSGYYIEPNNKTSLYIGAAEKFSLQPRKDWGILFGKWIGFRNLSISS